MGVCVGEVSSLFTAFGEPPLYTVLLDKEGRLKRVNYSCYLTTAADEPITYQREFQLDFRQFGDIELELPELTEADSPDLTSLEQALP